MAPRRKRIRPWRARTPIGRLRATSYQLSELDRCLPVLIMLATAELRRDLSAWIKAIRRRVDGLAKTLETEKARKAARRKKKAAPPPPPPDAT